MPICLLHKDCVSSMDVILEQIIKWLKTNEMNINCDKTKKMILGTATVQPRLYMLIATTLNGYKPSSY